MFTSSLPGNQDPKFYSLLVHNWNISKLWFTAALLARVVLFHQFLCRAILDSVVLGNDLRRRWLLAQIQPSTIFGSDVFNALTQNIATTSNATEIDVVLSRKWKEVTVLLHRLDPSLKSSDRKPSIFVVIDEAQDGVTQLPDAFVSGIQGPVQLTTRRKRPVLRQLVFTLTSALEEASDHIEFTHIVTGTGISKEMLEDAVSSTTFKEQTTGFVLGYNTGGFDYKHDQEKYITHYLGEDFPNSKMGKALCSRMWHWLQGR